VCFASSSAGFPESFEKQKRVEVRHFPTYIYAFNGHFYPKYDNYVTTRCIGLEWGVVKCLFLKDVMVSADLLSSMKTNKNISSSACSGLTCSWLALLRPSNVPSCSSGQDSVALILEVIKSAIRFQKTISEAWLKVSGELCSFFRH